jgi:hypothetical protein
MANGCRQEPEAGAVAHVETKPSDIKAPGRKATATGALPFVIETGDGAPIRRTLVVGPMWREGAVEASAASGAAA